MKEIIKTISYFSLFLYPPTFEEIYTFLPVKTSRQKLKQELERLIKKKIIKNLKFKIENCSRYTIGEYGIKKSKIKNQKLKIKNFIQRYQESEKKLNNWRFRLYVKLLSFFPQIKLVGISGSLAMMNAKKEDDIDLFIITSKNRLFTGRFIALVLAQLLNIRRSFVNQTQRSNFLTPAGSLFPFEVGKTSQVDKKLAFSFLLKNKVCLNLFFDESALQVPKFKQTEYVAHEVLQMRPIINKDNIYEKFLKANKWVLKIFPNAKEKYKRYLILDIGYLKKKKNNFPISNIQYQILNNLELILKKLQLKLINRHKTTELITDSQLWFHPDDFEKKLKLP